jgi:hypothetical protein
VTKAKRGTMLSNVVYTAEIKSSYIFEELMWYPDARLA